MRWQDEVKYGNYERSGLYNNYQLSELYNGLEDGVDVCMFDDHKYTDKQMKKIRESMQPIFLKCDFCGIEKKYKNFLPPSPKRGYINICNTCSCMSENISKY